ncbi:hypothetical protein C5708_12700 [Caulobacter sp. CCUG 60055]|uniref:hypothetical protein n=1 Tax=Caulobacter sp. CCUG 60055 TaxID=2100090 RepID=UPI001FA7DC1D|nr:hypothetical protein [Caulobacter sp. CCUG 60055]MBQ1542835.1 hypothetical protein [Caulobacteraceae bacterium]MCI3181112.1 hypothetical protein [Caulobacter sp. CCUG 60055]
MLFLLNDVILNVSSQSAAPPSRVREFQTLDLAFVKKLGAEIFAEEPLLHRVDRPRAERLALLIAAKAPQINAALFVSPGRNCPPDQVTIRFAQVGIEIISDLYMRQKNDSLTTLYADRQVWRRLAA